MKLFLLLLAFACLAHLGADASARATPDDSDTDTKSSTDDYVLEEIPTNNNAPGAYAPYGIGGYFPPRPRRYGKWENNKYNNRGLVLGLLDVLFGIGVTGTNHRKRWDGYKNRFVYSNEWSSGERRGWDDPDYYGRDRYYDGYYGDYDNDGDNDNYYPRRYGYGAYGYRSYPYRYGGYGGYGFLNPPPRRYRKVKISSS